MFKNFLFPLTVSGILLMAAGCQNSSDNNRGLDYDVLDVNFAATSATSVWAKDSQVGIFATCTRNDVQSTSMSTNVPACYKALSVDKMSYLTPVGESDNVSALASDHNFLFYAYAPYDASLKDVSNLPANVPATVSFGTASSSLLVAKAAVSSVVAPVKLNFSAINCTATVKVPSDIIDEEGSNVKSMVVRAAEPDKFSGCLARNAVYDFFTDKVTVETGSESKEITVDFGQSGHLMSSGYTEVSFAMVPFTVPEGGLVCEFTDVNGNTNTVPFLKEGEQYDGGAVIEATLSSSSDGIIPCSSPVEWPLGYTDNVGVFNTTVQPRWNAGTFDNGATEHVWVSSQAPATISYVLGSDHTIKFESNNFSQYNYSAGCVKGSWTGDYFEFDIPVKKFPANKTVKLTFPAYGRGAPLFWDFEYKDGEEWKCQRRSWTSPDGQFTQDCTLMIEHGNRDGSFEGIVYTVELPFTNEIKSGHILIRMKVADGSKITVNSGTYSTTCKELSAPTVDGTTLFTFVNKSGNCKAVTVEW